MTKLLTTTLLTFLACLPLQAMEIRVLAWDQDVAKRKLSIAYDDQSKTIRGMHHFTRSKAINVPASPENLRMVTNDRRSEEGKALSISIKIPESVLNPLLLIRPDAKTPVGIKVTVIEDSVEDFKWATLRFINATDENLIFKSEEIEQEIPNDMKPVTIALGGKSRNVGVSIYLKDKPDLPHLYSAIWKHREDLRQLIIIVPTKDDEPRFADFKFIVENKAVVEAENKQPYRPIQPLLLGK